MTEHTGGQTRESHGGLGAGVRPPAIGFPAVERLLEAQRVLYVELDALSRRQADLIESEATDELLGVLGKRQEVLDRIQAVNDAIAPVRANWRGFLETIAQDQRARLGSKVDAITSLIEAITSRDNADRRMMIEGRDRLATELAGVDKARAAAGAYGVRSAGGRPVYQDREA
ncbi:MAG: flagellar export chaperone FlgN [Phycisphaeraceae bacterium]|nr:flagellar export chaperone FlgN [Phycisphaerae bacterium]MBX3392883.1 flagellar export chaperone FlgN [Phycisphaeraceae bacterium]